LVGKSVERVVDPSEVHAAKVKQLNEDLRFWREKNLRLEETIERENRTRES
jgi:hypothetical protein